ncbi:Poly [Adp-Ribose] polymerase Tankyrase-2 [Manis pentadactyla]|nr:Poly [Adp-Ribose] polymerase Tankyrase-2 [Manis pentadactyla]
MDSWYVKRLMEVCTVMLTAAAGRDTVKKCLQKSRGWVGKKKGSEAPWEQVCFQRPNTNRNALSCSASS